MKSLIIKYEFVLEKICHFFSCPIIQILSFILYKIIVDLIYFLYIGRMSDYGILISNTNIISGYFITVILAIFVVIYSKHTEPSSFIMIVISMIYFVPITTYCSLGPGADATFFYMAIYAIWISVLWILVPTIGIKNDNIEFSNIFYYVLFVIVAIITIYISFRYTDFRIVTSLKNIYEIRAEAAEYDLPIVLSYFQQFSGIIIPMLILMSFYKKKYIFIFIGIILLIFNFSFAAQKSILFMGVLLIIGCIFWKQNMIYLIVPSGVVLGLLGLLEVVVSSHNYIISYFFRRQGFVLAQLSDEYYRFFYQNPSDLFRSTFIGKIGFDSPYNLQLSKVIGNNFSSQVINCNNGLLADVWAHLGVMGVIIMPFILIVCFRLFDCCCNRLCAKYYIGLSFYSAVLFANTTWSTVLLSHGYFIMCILFILFPRDERKKLK